MKFDGLKKNLISISELDSIFMQQILGRVYGRRSLLVSWIAYLCNKFWEEFVEDCEGCYGDST